MSQVDNLLNNSLSVDEPVAYTARPETEGHIVVGEDRFITVPEELKRIAVQFDNNIETVTFDCPRYWDNHDMSQMKVYINYLLPTGDPGSYIAKNISVDGDVMHFDWTISNHVTQFKGNLSFLVCIKKTDADGNESQHWNSELNRDLYISEGLECEETTISKYPDIITDLLTRMDTVESVAVTVEEANTVKTTAQQASSSATAAANIALEVQADVEEKLTTLGNSFANPIKRTARGNIVAVKDVSPIDHTAHVKVGGKNLFDMSKITTTAVSEYGYISEVGVNYIIVTTPETYYGNGNCGLTLKLIDVCPGLIAGQTYTLSGVSPSTNKCIYLRDTDKYWDFGASRILTAEDLQSKIVVYGLSAVHNNGYGDCKIENLQIETGNVITSYEPYIDPSTVSLRRCGKNILGFTESFSNTYGNGITLSYDIDTDIFTIDGTFAEGDTAITGFLTNYLANKPMIGTGNKATLTMTKVGGSVSTQQDYNVFYISCANSQNGSRINWFSTIMPSSGKTSNTKPATYDFLNAAWIYISRAATFNNYQFRIQLEIGDESTEYEPYKREVYEPAMDGTVDIKAVYPNMTICTNNAGVDIEVEYNVDSNIYLQELKDLINNSGGSQFNTNLTDTVTGDIYSMSVTNGKLTLTKLEV